MKIGILNQEQLIEGITASIFFPLTILFFRNMDHSSFFLYSMLAWFTTWIARKISVNIYLHFKKQYNWTNDTYYLNI